MQKKIDNALQKVDNICKQMVNITTRVNSIEQEMRTINPTCGEFHENLQGMGNVFDNVKEQTEKAGKNMQELKNKSHEMESMFKSFKLKEGQMKSCPSKSLT